MANDLERRVITAARAWRDNILPLPEGVELSAEGCTLLDALRVLDAGERAPDRSRPVFFDMDHDIDWGEKEEAVDNVTRTNGLEDKLDGTITHPMIEQGYEFVIDEGDVEQPQRGEFEIERLDHGYMVRIWQGRDPIVRLAFERAYDVLDEVERWLELDEDEDVLTDKGRERLDALKRGSKRLHGEMLLRGVRTDGWGL